MEWLHIERLRRVAQALREAPKAERFDMSVVSHDCNTPACALGHYAARPDLQSSFDLDEDAGAAPSCYVKLVLNGNCVGYNHPEVQAHFGLDEQDLDRLFGECGCAGAQTAKDAARYIDWFADLMSRDEEVPDEDEDED